MSDSAFITATVLGCLSPMWFACLIAWAFWPGLSSGEAGE